MSWRLGQLAAFLTAVRRLRLTSGLVLLTYVATHLATHALGLHSLEAMEWIVGRMGYGEGIYLTAVGDTVHVAARLEQLTKEYDCGLVVSEQVATACRWAERAAPSR